MNRLIPVAALLSVATVVVPAQTPTRTFIRAVGQGKVSGKPDQAQVDLAVVTQAATAQDAAAQNADKTTAVLTQLRQVLGAAAALKTINYSLTPNYNYPRDGSAPTLTGFTASNTVEATLGDLSLPGKVIDAAIQAGANRVDGLRFSLKDDQPLRAQALRAAAQQARTHAEAIAMGLGVRLGAVISGQEDSAVSIQPVSRMAATTASAPTPVEPGAVDVTATVTIEIAIAP